MNEVRAEPVGDVADVPDATSLWRLLVSGSAPGQEPRIAIEAFRRLHGAGQPHPFDSALLLCTDWRWRRTSARVLAGVLDSGVLEDAEQDRLAHDFLWRDEVPYEHPTGWFGETFVEIEIDPSDRTRTPRRKEVHVDPGTPMTSPRRVQPPLRTWAARRLLVRRRVDLADVLGGARALPARDAAAVMTGAVQAASELEPDPASTVIVAALGWGHKGPRLAALKHLAAHGEADRARALTASDPDASIRAWGETLRTGTASEPTLFD